MNAILQRPTQAVILAGGRGTRLRPITNTRPKPMVEFHGRPFLEYLIEMLREQGFKNVLLLLGYLPEVIIDYFGDGRRWGIKIDYSVSGPDDLTASRVRLARSKIEPCFLLMYCDNYWPMQIDGMWEQYVASKMPAMITVYSNKDNYSRDSVRIGANNKVVVFDRSRTIPGLKGVEISYAILDKSVLELLPEQDELFEVAIYPELVKLRQLAAYVSDHRYYSVGSHERLLLTKAFLARQPAIILDRDGVLNKRPPKANYVRTWNEFQWLPGALEALRLLKEAGYKVIVISNQAGIARGIIQESDVARIHEKMVEQALMAGGAIDAFYFCPHHWDDDCECRKPKPGMLFMAQREHHLDLTRTLLIGDDERDIQAADAAGCESVLVTDKYSVLNAVQELLAQKEE